MTNHAITIQTGRYRAIVHYSTVDAVFRLDDGTPVAMEFHRMLGPTFWQGEDEYFPEEDSEIWVQFSGWWEAKGKELFGVNR